MAGDGLCCVNGTICSFSTVKVFRLKDGSLYGACGGGAEGELHMKWIEGGCEGACPKLDSGFGFLLLRSDGRLFEGDEVGHPYQIEAPFAIGSGMDIALGAMLAGLTPDQAVEAAAKRNPHTGGKITVLTL